MIDRVNGDSALAAEVAAPGSEDVPPCDAPEAAEATHAVTFGVWMSGVRCLLVYVVAPLAGGLGGLLGLLGLALQVLATITCCSGTRTLWRTHHPARWPYTLIAALVLASTIAALVRLEEGPHMTPPTAAADASTAPPPDVRRPGRRRPPTRAARRKPIRRGLLLAHRWLSLVLGGLLVVIATTGSILVYEPEITRARNADAYRVSDPGAPQRVTLGQAAAIVAAAHPEAAPTSVTRDGDVLRVAGARAAYTLDPADGRIIGEVADRPGWLALARNIHHCLLTCKDLPGYSPWWESEVPGTGWLTTSGKPVDVSGFVLGCTALLMLFLAVSGLWLWLPRPRRLRAALTVRRRKGRFARDLDLHKVIGVAALVPMLVWGISGTGFEFGAVKGVWYALTPGSEAPAPRPPRPLAAGDARPDIGIDAAIAAATRAVPGEVMRVSTPKPKDPKGVYQVVLRRGGDAMAHSLNPGDIRVSVGRAGGEAVQTRGNDEHDLTQRIWEQWKYPLHAGTFVGPWVRALWFVGGLAPLALMLTGLSTWLFRRRTARSRAAARRANRSVAHQQHQDLGVVGVGEHVEQPRPPRS